MVIRNSARALAASIAADYNDRDLTAAEMRAAAQNDTDLTSEERRALQEEIAKHPGR